MNDAESSPKTLAREGNVHLAYHSTRGQTPGVIFLGGFRSDMTGTKAIALEQACTERGRAFVRFDYFGHGQSGGKFTDGTIARWRDDAIAVLDAISDGPQVLVGSSMGGWLMLLVALARPERVAGLVGIAAAPDFTEDLMWSGFDSSIRTTLETEGVYLEPSSYDPEPTPITMRLIEDGREHLVLRQPIPFSGPVRLVHGMDDPDVPWQHSVRTAEALTSRDVAVTLIKGGDHRLSEPHQLDQIIAAVTDACARSAH
jgi:pimeloyl-ACP methyl ester carboxylesterase